jgi:hypothetical protein
MTDTEITAVVNRNGFQIRFHYRIRNEPRPASGLFGGHNPPWSCAKTGMTAVELCDAVHAHGVWAQDTGLYSVRLVTHCDVDRAGRLRARSKC